MSPIAPQLLHHHEAVRRLARRLVVADDVDDVVQETMARALQHPPRGDLGAWLGRVLRNVVRFRRRSESRRRERETLAARRTMAPCDEATGIDHREPLDTLEELEAAEQVSRALRQLREPYRSVLVEHYFLRRPLADIARAHGVREDATRQRHKRGLEMIRIALGRTRGDGSPPLTNARLAAIFAPWLPPPPVAATPLAPTTLAAGSTSATCTLLLTMTTMKSKVALGIAAIAAIASLSTYAIWTSGSKPSPVPVEPPQAEALSAGAQAAEQDPAPLAATSRTEVLDAPVRTEDPAATGPGTEVRVVWDDDGSAASGMQVFLTEYGSWTSASPPGHIATTAADGIARFGGIAEGRYLVEGRFRLAESAPRVVDVGAEATAAGPIEIRILRGTTVVGRVVDPDGNGIPGASVLRAGWASPWAQEVGVTGPDGAFEIDGLHGRISMGAAARAFVPSVMQGMNLDEKQRATLEIVLQPAAAELTVRVVDASGTPVAGARAAVGIFGRQNQPRRGADGRHEHVMPAHTRTDDRGVAQLGGLAPGTWALEVVADGFSGYTGEVEVPPARSGGEAVPIEREVTLPRPITIIGTVRDSNGLPLERVHVAFGRSGHLVQASSRTGADGAYRLSGAPAGEVPMRAQRKGLDRRETIATQPGREHRWDVEFAAERKVHGSVTWQDGSPVPRAEFSVASIGPGARWHTIDHTDESGRFVLEMPEHVTSVQARVRAPGSFHQSVHEGPLPEGNFDIVLGPEHVPSATLSGRIVDPDGRPIPGANLWHALLGQGNSSPISVDAQGRFEKAVTPGTYNLSIDVDGFARARHRIALGTDETKDLGDLALEHPAAIHVTVDGAPQGQVDCWLTHTLTDQRHRLEIAEGQGSLGGLPGGTYRLQVCGDAIASESREVFLRAAPGGGDPTQVSLAARAATPLAITLPAPAGRPTSSSRTADIEILDATGSVVVRHRAGIAPDDQLYTKFALAPGQYELRVRDGDLSARATLSIPAATAEPHAVTLELRPGG